MIEVVCSFVVKEEARGHFELAYGPGGAWSTLFAECPGYRGTTLLRDTRDPRRYLAIEMWDSGAQREEALAERSAAYADLGAQLDNWVESRDELGLYRLLAEATVRPRASIGRKSGRGAGRGRR